MQTTAAVRIIVLRPLPAAHSPDSRSINFSLTRRIPAEAAAANAVTRHSAAITLHISPHTNQNSMHTPSSASPVRVPVRFLFVIYSFTIRSFRSFSFTIRILCDPTDPASLSEQPPEAPPSARPAPPVSHL